MPKVYLGVGRFDTNVGEDLMEMCLTSGLVLVQSISWRTGIACTKLRHQVKQINVTNRRPVQNLVQVEAGVWIHDNVTTPYYAMLGMSHCAKSAVFCCQNSSKLDSNKKTGSPTQLCHKPQASASTGLGVSGKNSKRHEPISELWVMSIMSQWAPIREDTVRTYKCRFSSLNSSVVHCALSIRPLQGLGGVSMLGEDFPSKSRKMRNGPLMTLPI